jgi:hypothetical protein
MAGEIMFEEMAGIAAKHGMVERHKISSAAILKWYDEVFTQDGKMTVCYCWSPDRAGFIAIDAGDPNDRNMVLCSRCVLQVLQEPADTRLVCNICGQAPADGMFTSVIIELKMNVMLFGNACSDCISPASE